jgi:hypothetical protein
MPQLSSEASDFNWLVGNFAHRTPGVGHAMVVSADGLPVAVSQRLDRPKALTPKLRVELQAALPP